MIDFQQVHSILAENCTTYLDFRDFENQVQSKQKEQGHLDNHAFLDYSARNWATHLHHMCIKDQEDSTSTILQICDSHTKKFKNWFAVYWKARYNRDNPELTALMVVSYFGFLRAVNLLLDKADANIQNKDGCTALHRAAWNGHEAVVKILQN